MCSVSAAFSVRKLQPYSWNLASFNHFRLSFCRYQQILHRNLVYLASIADANQNIQAMLPVSIGNFEILWKVSCRVCFTILICFFVLQPPQGVMVPPVQHAVHNTNAPPNQGYAPPANEMPNPQAPTPNNFPPQSNVYRGQPQPMNPQSKFSFLMRKKSQLSGTYGGRKSKHFPSVLRKGQRADISKRLSDA